MFKLISQIFKLLTLLLTLFSYNFALSNNIPDCEFLANVEEERRDLPNGILSSISRVEAGRIQLDGNKKGWPWTINHAGEGMFFENKNDAIDYVNDSISRGDFNIDVGCMQISIKWHSMNFKSLDEMFDPKINIEYAAKFLEHLYGKHDNWEIAIKHYHSSDPNKNIKYLKKVLAVWSINNGKNFNSNNFHKVNIILPTSRPTKSKIIIQDDKIMSTAQSVNSNLNKKIKANENIKTNFINQRWSLVEKFRKEFSEN